MNDLPLPPRAIALSKTKLLLLLLGACLFVALGVWMVQQDPAEIAARRRYNIPWLVHGIGVANIVFFGACALFVVKKLFDTQPGLLLTAQGLNDNVSGIAAGFVPWSDIAGFDIYHVQKQKMLVVLLHDPNKYITASRNPLVRKLRQTNIRMCGSPVVIPAATLQIGFDELHALCHQYYKQYGTAQRRTLPAGLSTDRKLDRQP